MEMTESLPNASRCKTVRPWSPRQERCLVVFRRVTDIGEYLIKPVQATVGKVAQLQAVSGSGCLDMVDDRARLLLISCPRKLIVDNLIAVFREGIDCNLYRCHGPHSVSSRPLLYGL
jgi:hypothetical protein